MTVQEIINVILENDTISGLVVVSLFVIIPSLIQISPVQVNPWSWLRKEVKELFMGDVVREIKTTNQQLKDFHEESTKNITDIKTQTVDLNCQVVGLVQNVETLNQRMANNEDLQGERYAKALRRDILEFGDSLYAHSEEGHTKERFDSILEVITEYENYCSTHPNFKNEQAVATIAYIKKAYQDCCMRHSFL